MKSLKFIVLVRWRKKLTKGVLDESRKLREQAIKDGVKFLDRYWTFGRFDGVSIVEAPDEKIAMKALLRYGDLVSTETLVAVPYEEGVKLVE